MLAQCQQETPGPELGPAGGARLAQHQHGAEDLALALQQRQHGGRFHLHQGLQARLHLVEGYALLLQLDHPVLAAQQLEPGPRHQDAIGAVEPLSRRQEGGAQQQALIRTDPHLDSGQRRPGGLYLVALAPADATGLAAAEDLHRQLTEQQFGLLGIARLQGTARGDDQPAAGGGNRRVKPAEKSGGSNQDPGGGLQRQLFRVVDAAAIERTAEGQRQQDAKQQAVDVLVTDTGQHPTIGQPLAPQRHLHPQLRLQLGPGLGDRLGLAGGAGAEQGEIEALGQQSRAVCLPLVIRHQQRQPELRRGECLTRQLAIGEQAIELTLQRLQTGQPLMARQDCLIATEGAGEQCLREQQAVIEAESPARTWLAGAGVAGHGPGQLQAAAAQLGQGHLAALAERHHPLAVSLPDSFQQGHGASLLSRRRRTRYSAPIRPPIRA